MSKLSEAQRFDEKIVARIVAAAESSPYGMGHKTYGVHREWNGDGTVVSASGPVCAVGAGSLWRTISSADDVHTHFAAIHRVSIQYVYGVSDGYEDGLNTILDGANPHSLDYQRGYAVGEAVRSYAEDCDQ